MFGTIRRHQKWLWLTIVVITIPSFLWVFRSGSGMNTGPGRGSLNFGTLNGEHITAERYFDAEKEATLHHFVQSRGHWPDQTEQAQLERDTYQWLLLVQEQERLGIHISSDQAKRISFEIVRQLDPSGQLTRDMFMSRILQQRGLQPSDLERYCEHYLGLRELAAIAGVGGMLLTPDEAKAIYERQYQELATEAVFFSTSNHLAEIAASDQDIGEYYTNHMANYRIPDRVQVQYVQFDASNFLAQAQTELKSNLTDLVEANLSKLGTNYGEFGKTREEARTNLQDKILHYQALSAANKEAKAFANALFGTNELFAGQMAVMDMLPKAANVRGLTVGLTSPFDYEGPTNLALGSVSNKFVQAAMNCSSNKPFAGPLVSDDAVFEIAFYKQIPGGPSLLEQVRDRVTADFKLGKAQDLVHKQADEFYATLTNGLAQGRTFTNLCLAANLKPVSVPPFSRSTRELTNFDASVSLNLLQQLAFSTRVGSASPPAPTRDGGMILFVQAKLPLDQVKMLADMPRFTAALRDRQSEANFELWFNSEYQKVAREIPQPQESPGPGSRQGRILTDADPIKLSSPDTGEIWELPVLYEDEHLLALSKPAGLDSSPDSLDPARPNLLGLLHAGVAESKAWARKRNLAYLMVAHRLDADASGVILLARSKPMLVALTNFFGAETPGHEYTALVAGKPAAERFEVEAKLAPHPVEAGLVRVDSRDGKRSRSRFTVIEEFSRWALLKCEVFTHRPHQLRAHLRHAGLPLVGDRLYGGQPLLLSRLKSGYRLKPNHTERPLISRPAMHSEKLSLPHPITGELLTITAPWPKDLSVAVKYLRRYALKST